MLGRRRDLLIINLLDFEISIDHLMQARRKYLCNNKSLGFLDINRSPIDGPRTRPCNNKSLGFLDINRSPNDGPRTRPCNN